MSAVSRPPTSDPSRQESTVPVLRKVAILTNEYPPHVYGGAGVHVEYLTRELARIEDGRHTVQVLCFGEQVVHQGNLRVQGVRPDCPISCQDPRHTKLMDTLVRDLLMA